MSSSVAKVFMSGHSQTVRLPKEFRLPGKEVRIRRFGNGILLEPIRDLAEVFAELDRCNDLYGPLEIERDQPPMPPSKTLFE